MEKKKFSKYKYASGYSKRVMKARKQEQLKAQEGSLEKYCIPNAGSSKKRLTEKFHSFNLKTAELNAVNSSILPENKNPHGADVAAGLEENNDQNVKDVPNIINQLENDIENLQENDNEKMYSDMNQVVESSIIETNLNCISMLRTDNDENDFITNSDPETHLNCISMLRTDNENDVITNSDPAKWTNISEKQKEYFVSNPPRQHIEMLSLTERKIGNTKRFLNEKNFYRIMKNGEKLKREWLILSPSNLSVYCYVCKLFSNSTSALATTGFNDWKHISERLAEHENSTSHRQAVCSLASRMKFSQRIDSKLIFQYETECKYWQTILTRVVAVIKHLAKRGLPFFGDNETLFSPHNGNFLGCLELIAEFDPFLARHLENFGNPGKGHVNYLSSSIINEFVSLMSQKVLKTIIKQVQQAKYFSIIVDSTPDIAHIDQLSLVVRYIDESLRPVERFLTFIPIQSHTSEYLTNLIFSTLENYGLNVMNIRGQSYDNASNMSGKYFGVQARIKEVNPLAEYVPCSAHTLNLVAMHGVENSCTQVTAFFALLQKLYNFFSASTRRWNILKDKCKKPFTLKSHSSTRWCADADATKSLRKNFAEIVSTLNLLSESSEESALTRHEASSLFLKMQKMETAVNSVVWDTILQRLNKSSKHLQNVSASLESVVLLFNSLITFVQNVRDSFSVYEEEAKLLNKNAEYHCSRKRKVPKSRFLDDGETTPVNFSPRDNFKVNCHYALCDALKSQLTSRKVSYENILEKFSFLINFEESEAAIKAQSLQEHYNSDLDEEFAEEYMQFLPMKKKDDSVLDTLNNLQTLNMRATFPNVELALKLFLTLPISNCTSERSFSLLKRLKSPLRSTLKEEKLCALAILSFENDVTSDLDYSDIIYEFANQKIRKKPINSCAMVS